jgi:hypothetical protein
MLGSYEYFNLVAWQPGRGLTQKRRRRPDRVGVQPSPSLLQDEQIFSRQEREDFESQFWILSTAYQQKAVSAFDPPHHKPAVPVSRCAA